MISGFATEEGTVNFSKKSGVDPRNYRISQGLTLSNVGIGTYLGQPDSETDQLVKNAVKKTILSGINVLIYKLRSVFVYALGILGSKALSLKLWSPFL